jgi:UDPglucose 6-dehydrogenase|tara:strand:+ start:822 stop:1574 length:753 start_codon:yes stop_codon:yes gene_type:complete
MKLTLIGYGFVGKAVYNVLKDYHNVKIVDPQYNENVIDDDSEGYIICVPTPTTPTGACNMTIVETVVKACPQDKPILIKSTISLEGWRKDLAPMNKQITFSPEFLTAANANEDFEKQNKMLFGGGNSEFWNDVFILCKMFTPVYATVEELIMTKYLRNSFLATKVAFFNEVSDLCKIANISYNSVKDLVGMDERITPSHMQVPGPDGELGFGGACFPKDTEALLYSAHVVGVSMPILHAAVKSNNNKRKD